MLRASRRGEIKLSEGARVWETEIQTNSAHAHTNKTNKEVIRASVSAKRREKTQRMQSKSTNKNKKVRPIGCRKKGDEEKE